MHTRPLQTVLGTEICGYRWPDFQQMTRTTPGRVSYLASETTLQTHSTGILR